MKRAEIESRILTYMRDKGKIIDELTLDTNIESFYTVEDERDLRKLLKRSKKVDLIKFCQKALDPDCDGDICPFCRLLEIELRDNQCNICGYFERHRSCNYDQNSTYMKVVSYLRKKDISNRLRHLQKIKKLIEQMFSDIE